VNNTTVFAWHYYNSPEAGAGQQHESNKSWTGAGGWCRRSLPGL